jgi:outer membrane receptor protein involved in Fe transport
MKQISQISDLKLRFSWGTAGNYNIGDYSSISQLSTYGYALSTAPNSNAAKSVVGRAVNASANPDLTWETSNTLDYGVDLGVLKNRITASFDYYNKLNTGLLLNVPIPGATGFNTTLSNTGKVRNKGWEVELTTHNLTGKFTWTTAFNLSHNANKVEALGPGQTQIQFPSSFDVSHSIDQIGLPMNSIFVVRQIGILSQADIDNKAPQFGVESAGDPKYYDYDKNGVIDANDRVVVGHPYPDYVWGVTNTVSFKGFDLSILVQGQQGGVIYSLLGRALSRTGQSAADNFLGRERNRWRSADNPGDGMTPKAYSTFGRIVNTDWLYSSDYWRIRDITLGYDLGKLMKIKQIQGARIYVTAENWFGHDRYTGGCNPEALNTDVSGSSTFPEAGDYGGLPLAKSLIVGLNLTF